MHLGFTKAFAGIKAIGGSGVKNNVKLILKNLLLWFERFLQNIEIQLRSEDMTDSIFGVLTFIKEKEGSFLAIF